MLGNHSLWLKKSHLSLQYIWFDKDFSTLSTLVHPVCSPCSSSRGGGRSHLVVSYRLIQFCSGPAGGGTTAGVYCCRSVSVFQQIRHVYRHSWSQTTTGSVCYSLAINIVHVLSKITEILFLAEVDLLPYDWICLQEEQQPQSKNRDSLFHMKGGKRARPINHLH